jgi:hypothetical protein
MSSLNWQLQPLRSFWQGVNWENQPLAPTIGTQNGDSYPTLSFMMSVRQYFRAISWTGIPEIAVTTHEPTPSNAIDESNETLENFLDDISKFF